MSRLSVYDMLGNKVYEINEKIVSGTHEMDLGHLPAGSYFVEIVKDSKPVFTKIVISK